MSKSSDDKIQRSRRILQNPYAYLDDRGLYSIALDSSASAVMEAISNSRRILQNPYAYLDGDGNFSAIRAVCRDQFSRRSDHSAGDVLNKTKYRSNSDIEICVKGLQNQLWRERHTLWPTSTPINPIEVLDPEIALKLIGFNCETAETLGFYRKNGVRTEVAGEIDQSEKLIKISRQLPRNTYAFTLAHELGHAVMHSEMQGMHRDRPMDGSKVARDKVEIEADKFAAYFLLPEKTLKDRFAKRFMTDRFELTNDTAFALARKSLSEVKAAHKSMRSLSRFIASAEKYNGVRFVSLTEEFSVTKETLAIRLEELGLILF